MISVTTRPGVESRSAPCPTMETTMRSVARIPRGAPARSTAAPDEHQVARITGILGRRSRRHGFTDRPKSRRSRPSGAFAWREAKCPRLDKAGEPGQRLRRSTARPGVTRERGGRLPRSVAFDTLRADHRSPAISQGRPSPGRSSRRSTKLVEALLTTVE
jgi:hypothetical protein